MPIIEDDGSTDQASAIINRYAVKDARIKLGSRGNTGIQKAANEGLEICRGEFVSRIDSDDVALSLCLERQLKFMRRSGVVTCGTATAMIDAKGRYFTTLTMPEDHDTILSLLLKGHCSISHPSSMMRREAVTTVGGYHEEFRYSHDVDIFLRLGEIGRLGNLQECLLQYRLHAASISETQCVKQREECRMASENAVRRLCDPSSFDAAEIWRPASNRFSQHDFALRYGWWAFNSGERRTAVVYELKAVAAAP